MQKEIAYFINAMDDLMDLCCKRCGSDGVCKNGFASERQRYFCKVCDLNFTIGDLRVKHDDRTRRAAIELYVEGCGFRRISRLLKKIFDVDVCYQLVIKWVKSAAQKIPQQEKTSPGAQRLKVPIMELDELYSYIKKKQIRSEYGLLLIGTGYVLLDLRSATRALKPSENYGIK